MLRERGGWGDDEDEHGEEEEKGEEKGGRATSDGARRREAGHGGGEARSAGKASVGEDRGDLWGCGPRFDGIGAAEREREKASEASEAS